MPTQALYHPQLSLPTSFFNAEILPRMNLMKSSILSAEVSGGLFEVASSLESPPRGPGVGKAVAITRSSPREKATGLKAPVPEARESSQ